MVRDGEKRHPQPRWVTPERIGRFSRRPVASEIMVLPEGFGLPPLGHLVALVVGIAAVAWGLWHERPAVTEDVVVAFAPWMIAGAAMHVLFVLRALPDAVGPFFGTPSSYFTTFVVGGATWLVLAHRGGDVPGPLAAVGGVLVLAVVGTALAWALARGTLQPVWPVVGLVVSVAIATVAWLALSRVAPDVTATTGGVGALAVFGHILDGVSTAVGVDVLGFAERTPLSRLVLETAAGLPTADAIGSGWLFVAIKLTLAFVVVWLFADYVREEPTEGYLLLAVVAAVGLGPGTHNLLLFAVVG